MCTEGKKSKEIWGKRVSEKKKKGVKKVPKRNSELKLARSKFFIVKARADSGFKINV